MDLGETMTRRRCFIATVLLCLGILLSLAPAIAGPAEQAGLEQRDQRAFVDSELSTQLETKGQAEMLVYLSAKAELSAAAGMNWEERGWFVYNTLTAVAARSQAPVKEALDQMGLSYTSFWIDNVILVEAGNRAALEALARMPEVEAIILAPVGFLPEPEIRPQDGAGIRAPISSIQQINAPAVWGMGIRGQGAVVGIIDSGTRHTHVALVNQYRGNLGGGTFNHNYNWFDVAGSSSPQSPNPHGTHVTGTVVGDDGGSNQIGVAPDARWISCLGCTSTSCPSVNLLSCGQFMAAPTDLAGNNPNPSLRPHVVNNSWGGCQQSYDPWYQGVVDAWVAAGVIPVFANGNASICGYSSPPGLNTVGNPGRYGSVLGIGSTGNNNGQYANHSNWGPTDNPNPGTNPLLPDRMGHPELKPNVVAPGVNIFSSVSGSDTAFGNATGTSMSAPAASGVLALMVSAAPTLAGDYRTLGTLLMQTANRISYNSGGPNVGPGNVPNHATGWGEIDAMAAVLAAMAAAGPQGVIEGQVTDQTTGDPISGVAIRIDNPDPGGTPAFWATTTDASGNYSLTVSVGTYDVQYRAFGYLTYIESDVLVEEDQTLVIDVELQPAPSFVASGTVADANTGWPLHARISIAGFPGSPIYTNPANGSYSVQLPQGSVFSFTVDALSGGYVPETRDLSLGTFGVTPVLVSNFELEADLLACSAPGYADVSTVAYAEDFSGGNGGFTLSEPSPAPWQFGTPTTWPGACASGSQCWGTNLSGNYNNSANQTVTSPVIDLSAATAPVTLRWWQANHIEHFQWDKAFVEMRINEGEWVILWQNPPSPTVAEPWRELSRDISAAVGQSIQLRWRFTSDSSVVFPGLYFDDISIRGAPQCVVLDGELVSGRVVDANTGSALDGAQLSVGGVVAGVTAPSADPALGAGAFNLFVPAGNQTLAAGFPGYQESEFSAVFVAGQARRVDFALAAGSLSTDPANLTASVTLGDTGTQTLSLINSGGADAAFSAQAISRLHEDFEAPFPPNGWTVENLGGACTWVRNDAAPRPNFAGGDGFSAAADSDACGTGTTMDTALISPEVPVGAASTLDFVLSYRHLGTSQLNIDVRPIGAGSWTTIQAYTADLSPSGPGTPVSLALAAYAGQTVQIRFRYVSPAWNWWAQVDQIEITAPIDWLEIAPTSGTVGANGQASLTASFDAGAASITSPGEYTASIVIDNATPYGTLVVPVTMMVEPSAEQALLTGQISGLGYCDVNPAPAAGAAVVVSGQTGTFNLAANAEGVYQVWLATSEAPLSITASAADHGSATVSNVGLPPGGIQVEDLGLRWNRPCADIDADPIAVTLVRGQTSAQTFSIRNDGAGVLDFNIVEIDGGFAPLGTSSQQSGGIGDAWEVMAPLPAGRVFNAVVADENGFVYVIGGTSDAGASVPTNTNFRYDTASNTWATMAPLPVALDSIYGVLIGNRIFIPGSATTATTYVYDIATDSWSTLPANNGYTARSQYSTVAIGTDLYVLGGIVSGTSTPQVWILDTTTGTWRAGVPMQRTRTSLSAGVVGGEIFVAGGVAFPGFAPDMTAERFDGTAWTFVAGVPADGGLYTRWSYHATSVGSDGLWLAAGRRDAGWNVLNHAGYYSPDADAWVTSPAVPTLNQGRVYMAGATATDGYFYVIGGRDGAGAVIYATNERLQIGRPGGPGEVLWLDQNPKTGSVAGDGGSQVVELSFDASVVDEDGDYTATVRVISNDPQRGVVNIPVLMRVTSVDEIFADRFEQQPE